MCSSHHGARYLARCWMGKALASTFATTSYLHRAIVTDVVQATYESIKKAADRILAGELVAFPSETIYGLGANATNSNAVAKIFEAKGRPSFNPLIIHVPSIKIAKKLTKWNKYAAAIAQRFWPGAITFILPKSGEGNIADIATAGLDTIAIRFPSHKTALKLLELSGVPIAAPSANISGRMSPTTPAHVAHDLKDKVSMILADGASPIGLESTVIDLTSQTPCILRAGAIGVNEISQCIGKKVTLHDENSTSNSNKVRSPGMLLRHYAPNTPIRLKAIDIKKGEGLLAFGSTKFMNIKDAKAVKNLSESGDLYEAASNLFAHMRALDDMQCSAIAAMDIPNTGIGIAINDRLTRAAQDDT